MSAGESKVDPSNILIGHTNDVVCAIFNNTGTKLASASFDGSIRIWDVDTNECLIFITPKALKKSESRGDTAVHSLDWNATGTKIVCGLEDASIRIYNIETGEESLRIYNIEKGHKSTVNCVKWNATSDKIASISFDKSLRVWNPLNREEIFLFRAGEFDNPFSNLEWHPNANHIAAGTLGGKIYILDPDAKTTLNTFVFNNLDLLSLAFDPSGTKLACGFLQGIISIINTENGTQISVPLNVDAPVRALAWSSDGKKLASTGKGSVLLWDIETLFTTYVKEGDRSMKASTYKLYGSMEIINVEDNKSVSTAQYLDWSNNKIAVCLQYSSKNIYILDVEKDISIKYMDDVSKEKQLRNANMDDTIDLTQDGEDVIAVSNSETESDMDTDDEEETQVFERPPLPLVLRPERIKVTDRVSSIRRYQRNEQKNEELKKHVYVFACVNDRPQVLMPNMNVYAYCAYALYFLPGEHRMIIYDTEANFDNIRDAVQNFYGLNDEALSSFFKWFANHVSFGLYIQNLDKLKEAVRVNANECLSFLYLSAHGDENGKIGLPGGHVLSTEELKMFSLCIGEIRGVFQHCLSKDFQCMLNGCFLGRFTASFLSRCFHNRLVLGCTQCIPSGGVVHSFKVADNRLDFSARVKVGGENRLYAYYNEVASIAMRCAYVFVQDASTILEREFAQNKHIQCVESNSVKTIGDSAFIGCINLKNVDMRSVETVGKGAFMICGNLFDVKMPNVKIIENESFVLCGEMDIIMNNVETVKNGAFRNSRIERAIMPNVKTLGAFVFENCVNLTEISMRNITEFKEETFLNCTNLKRVYAPSLEIIHERAFEGTNNATVIAPKINSFPGIRLGTKRGRRKSLARRVEKKPRTKLLETFCKLRF